VPHTALSRQPAAPADQKACILCGRCLEVCPLLAATGREELSPRAKFLLAQRLEAEPGALAEADVAKLAGLCLACGRCEAVCPQGQCAPDLVSGLRAKHPGWQGWFWRQWIERGGALWPAAALLGKLAPAGMAASGAVAASLDKLRALAAPPLAPWLAPRRISPCLSGEKAVLFPGCLAAHVRSRWTGRAQRLLAALGAEALPDPGFSCCGCTLGHAGQLEAQARLQAGNLEAWRRAGRPLVVVFCATCRCGLRHYAELDLGWAPGEAEQWLAAVRPLAGLLDGVEWEVLEDAAPTRVHYHTPCHGAGGGFDAALVRRAAGNRLGQVGQDRCCGLGGVMQLAAPDLGRQVARLCWEHFAAAPGEQLLTACSGCVLQLTATAPEGVAVGHWLDAVALT
jgi:glycolate oxidase iron-sulfur subunit